ncbi:amidohydrolase family protein [Mycobacterium scrofulaceum]|uniref:Amidohydrolase n=1 Tax=Mycobacterium scrofulaceum TaxID=1783 RepID=A0A1A2WAR3_MYCSC|nr:amidohydrolase family protein [Mycobacterium scrofulaceum]OBI10654.1 amidohydrolase [Mycobacterium scrofulaceum]
MISDSRRPGFVDVHAHFVTNWYADLASAAGHRLPDGMPNWPNWSAEAHLQLMDRSGIDTAILSVSSPGVHFGDDAAARLLARRLNEYAAGIVRDHPGRFGLFATLPLPDVGGGLAEITYAFDSLGADGIILETNFAGVYLGDARLEPIFAELDRRGAVVLIHPTSPVCWQQTALGRPRPMIEFIFDTARTIIDMLFAGTFERHTRLQVIVPHCGGALPVVADRVNGFMKLAGHVDDGSSDAITLMRRLYYDTAGSAFPRQIPALLSLVDPDRLLYGSDYPWTPAPVAEFHTAAFMNVPGPAGTASWPAVMTANAHRLLPRLGR